MPVVVLASPKGGVGKSTCSVILATEFVRMGVKVKILDCDPNKSVTWWGEKSLLKNIKLLNDLNRSEIVSTIRKADEDGKIVIVNSEGIASQLVSRAISQADLVIVPMRPTALDSDIGSEVLTLVREEGEALNLSINHALVLTKTSDAIRTRTQKELEEDLTSAGIDLIYSFLTNHTAFVELFPCGGDLTAMMNNPVIVTGRRIDKAVESAFIHGSNIRNVQLADW